MSSSAPSSTTRPARRVNCNRSDIAGFAAAHGFRRPVIVLCGYSSIDENSCKRKEQSKVNENGDARRTPAEKELSERPQGYERDGGDQPDDGKAGDETKSLLTIA